MAKLDDGDGGTVSLFPMFNILACTLGIMIFILATAASVSLGAGKTVEIVADAERAAAQGKTATWFEWDGTELVLHPSLERVVFDRELRDIPTWAETYDYVAGVLGGTPVGARIAQISLDSENQYIILLVRPSGFASFVEIRGYLENLGIDLGYEPLNQHWRGVVIR